MSFLRSCHPTKPSPSLTLPVRVSSRHGKITMALTFPPGSNGTTWPSVPPSATCRDPDTFLRLWAMKESALPIDLDPKLVADCMGVLRTVLGPQLYTKYKWVRCLVSLRPLGIDQREGERQRRGQTFQQASVHPGA